MIHSDKIKAEVFTKFLTGTKSGFLVFHIRDGQGNGPHYSSDNYSDANTTPGEWQRAFIPEVIVPEGPTEVIAYYRANAGTSTTYFDDLSITVTQGNVDVEYTADVISYSDYYGFGMQMPGRFSSDGYRYGFNGKELDQEGMGGGGSTYDYGFRIYNPQLGRFLSIDPLSAKFPFYTPYQFAGNKPIVALDLDGREDIWIHEITNLDTKIKTTTIKEVDENVKKEIIAFLGYDPDAYNEGGMLSTSATIEDGVTYRVADDYVKPVVVTANPSYKEGIIMKTLKSIDINMEGEQGLKKYSNALNNTGNSLKAGSLVSGPAAPVVAGLGEGLSLFSDAINTALDFKNKDIIDASINTGIRLVSFGVGKYFDKSLEGVQSQLPKSLGEETIGEKVLKLGVDLGLDKVKDIYTED